MEVFHFLTEGKGNVDFWESGQEGGKIGNRRRKNVSDSYCSVGE